MKESIIMGLILVVSIFAGAFALAETEDSIEVSEVETLEVETNEIQETIEEIEIPNQYKRAGFSNVWVGHGWIENDEEGRLIRGFWVSQGFAKISTSNNEVDNAKIIRAFGRLTIAGEGDYRLIRAETNEDITEVNSVSFYLIPINKKRYLTEESLEADSVGKLVLNKEQEYKGLTTWNGNLEFEKGNLEGSWDVELGTNKKVVRTAKLAAVADAKKAATISFWKRIQFWKRQRVELESNDGSDAQIANKAIVAKKVNALKSSAAGGGGGNLQSAE